MKLIFNVRVGAVETVHADGTTTTKVVLEELRTDETIEVSTELLPPALVRVLREALGQGETRYFDVELIARRTR